MASFAGRRPSRSWTVEECAVFAARKEFELLKLLSTDKKALATARRLGFFVGQTQRHDKRSFLQMLRMLPLRRRRQVPPMLRRRLLMRHTTFPRLMCFT